MNRKTILALGCALLMAFRKPSTTRAQSFLVMPGPIAGLAQPLATTAGYHFTSSESVLGIPTRAFGELVIGFVLFVAAAGNSNQSDQSFAALPQMIDAPNILVVGAVSRSGTPAAFTTFGKKVQIYAPGDAVIGRVCPPPDDIGGDTGASRAGGGAGAGAWAASHIRRGARRGPRAGRHNPRPQSFCAMHRRAK